MLMRLWPWRHGVRSGRPRPRRLLTLEWLESRELLATSLAATVLPPTFLAPTSMAPAQVDTGSSTQAGTLLTPSQADSYPVLVTPMQGSGLLTAQVSATGGTLVPRLRLLGPYGQTVLQSDDGNLSLHLEPGSYALAVSARQGMGSYQLTTRFVPADPPLAPAAAGPLPEAVAAADVNGDGIPDLVVANYSGNSVSVLLGNGDGSFQPQRTFPVGQEPRSVAVADVNADGLPDIVLANRLSDSVGVLLGNGDGTFQAQQTFAAGTFPVAVAVADIQGKGTPDLITVDAGSGTVTVIQDPLGSGTTGPSMSGESRAPEGVPFIIPIPVGGPTPPPPPTTSPPPPISPPPAPPPVSGPPSSPGGPTTPPPPAGGVLPLTFSVGAYPNSLVVGDVNGDGIPDLVITNAGDNTVSVLLGKGDATFQPQQTFAVGSFPTSVTLGDVNGDSRPDLLVANARSNTVSILENTTPAGATSVTFQSQQTLAAGAFPAAVALADVNGDGRPDLLVANALGNTVSVLLGNGDGSFHSRHTFHSGSGATALVVVDVNGDGKPDLVTANSGTRLYTANTVSVLLGNGDGSFQSQQVAFGVGPNPRAVKVVDLNGDGKPDLVTPNGSGGSVSVLLGHGDGTFGAQQTFAAGSGPIAVAVADLNGDGRPDLIVADYYDNSLSVLLGNGDATFQPARSFAVGSRPFSVAVADVNGDGNLDLVAANALDSTVSVLLGKGDGTFQSQQAFPVGPNPEAVVVADVNGDGKLDLITANNTDGSVSVLLGDSTGTFAQSQTFAVGPSPTSVAAADLNGDGKLDLVTTNYLNDTVSVLLGNGDGTFQTQQTYAVGAAPVSVQVADVNGDQQPDLVVANLRGPSVSVLQSTTPAGAPDLSFQPQQVFPVGDSPEGVAVADVNGDGRPDLVTANGGGGTVSVLLGRGSTTFSPTTALNEVASPNTPYLADLDGDGIPDSVILDRSGNLLFRKGLPGVDHPFAAPVILNPDRPARDLTVVKGAEGWAVAAADAHFDAVLSSANHFVYTVSLYTIAANDIVRRSTAFSGSLLPTRITAADLSGAGRDDLIVADALDDTLQVAFQQADGTFSLPLTLPTGETPSDLATVDVNADHLPDIVVSNRASGSVNVFLNNQGHSFTEQGPFRAGTGLYSVDTTGVSPVLRTLEQSVSLAVGGFTGNDPADLVVVNRGTHSFSVLPNDGSGGFDDPQAALTTSTSDGSVINDDPGPVGAGDFNGDGHSDLAILMEDRGEVWIYTGEGDGNFRHTFSIPVGNLATGLSLTAGDAPGLLDLLVGNEFGDILRLHGRSDGTFQVAGNRVALAVQDLGDGHTAALVADQVHNQVSLQTPTPGGTAFTSVLTLTDGTTAFAPGAVQWARLEGPDSPYFDAVVLASGSNEVLVYRGTGFDTAGRPTFAAPQTYFVGTDPVGLTIQDINGDGVPDLLVADQGSNDVALIFGGRSADGSWEGTSGPRLNAGGRGPLAVAVRKNGSGSPPDLVITNGGSANLTVLPGVGQGFFNDQHPQSIPLPGVPVAAPTLVSPGQAIVPLADGTLVSFSLSHPANSVQTVFVAPSGHGVTAVAALANGNLAVAEQGGTVELLGPIGEGGDYGPVASLRALTGVPLEPSALAVLEQADGLRVLVTNEGENQVFVFGFGPVPSGEGSGPAGSAGVLTIVLPTSPVIEAPVAETTVPSEAPLVLVLTVVTGILPAADTNAIAPAQDPEASSPAVTTPGNEDSTLSTVSSTGGVSETPPDEEVAQAEETPVPEESEVGPLFQELLHQIDLYLAPEEPNAGNPTSWLRPAALPVGPPAILPLQTEALSLAPGPVSDSPVELPVGGSQVVPLPAAVPGLAAGVELGPNLGREADEVMLAALAALGLAYLTGERSVFTPDAVGSHSAAAPPPRLSDSGHREGEHSSPDR